MGGEKLNAEFIIFSIFLPSIFAIPCIFCWLPLLRSHSGSDAASSLGGTIGGCGGLVWGTLTLLGAFIEFSPRETEDLPHCRIIKPCIISSVAPIHLARCRGKEQWGTHWNSRGKSLVGTRMGYGTSFLLGNLAASYAIPIVAMYWHPQQSWSASLQPT